MRVQGEVVHFNVVLSGIGTVTFLILRLYIAQLFLVYNSCSAAGNVVVVWCSILPPLLSLSAGD